MCVWSKRLWSAAMTLGVGVGALAQPAGQLYDPDPPPNSAYARWACPGFDGRMQVKLAGATKDQADARQPVTPYWVLPKGAYAVEIQASGPGWPLKIQLDLAAQQVVTLACVGQGAQRRVVRIDDQKLNNQLKAMLATYNLRAQPAPVSLLEATSGTRIVADLASGTGRFVPVNPIAAKVRFSDASHPDLAQSDLALTRGDTFSLFVFESGAGTRSLLLKNSTHKYVKP